MKSISVSQHIYNKLCEHNIKYVFGYSGGALLPLLDKFYKSEKIKFIKNSTEQCSGFVGEGYTKSINLSKPGIILSTSGPGLTNLITPLQNAYSDGSPLIAISGQVPTNAIGTDAFQECDAVNLTKYCTKWNYRLKYKEEINDVLDKAFKISMEPRKGPVHIDIPKDILLENVYLNNRVNYGEGNIIYHNKNIDFGIYNNNNINIDYLENLLNFVKRPIIIAGQGCNNEYIELRKFAKKFNIANYAVQNADLIIAIGTRFDDRTTGNIKEYGKKAIKSGLWGAGGIIHIDSSIRQINKVIDLFNKNYKNEDSEKFLKSINIDSKSFFNSIKHFKGNENTNEWLNELNVYKNNNKYYYYEDKNKIKTPDVIKSIDKQLNILNISKENVIFTTGVGNHQMWTSQYIKWTHPGKMITSGSLGTMGVGVPFAIGSKLANPDNMVICIDGDSSFTMTSNELQTLLENNIPIKIAIMNDSRQQMVYTWQKLFHNERFIGTTNINPNFVNLGKAYNIKTLVCSNKKNLNRTVKNFLKYEKAVIGIFNVEPEMCFPLVAPGKALDDMIKNKEDVNHMNKNVNAPN
jgi:acetolactate synthase-1/2/3 large subunit